MLALEAPSQSSGSEVERQLAAAVERHRELVASNREPGRPEAGQHVAVKAVGRAVQLVSFALKRAAETGVPLERLVELTGWEPAVVREALDWSPERPRFVASLTPTGLDAGAVAQAAAAFEAIARLETLTGHILTDVQDEAWSPAAADFDDLRERLETEWRAWREAVGRHEL